MLYKRRLMHSDAIGIPTDWPMMIRVADIGSLRWCSDMQFKEVLTYVAPNGGNVHGTLGKYNGVHELIQASQRRPNHVVAGSRVPGLQMPW